MCSDKRSDHSGSVDVATDMLEDVDAFFDPVDRALAALGGSTRKYARRGSPLAPRKSTEPLHSKASRESKKSIP